MFLNQRIKCFLELGERLKSLSEDRMVELSKMAGNQNTWFTPRSVKSSIHGIGKFLKKEVLEDWVGKYDFEKTQEKKVGVIAAGNIPLVGFHDAMCVLIAGHILNLKMSSDDGVLMQFVLDELIDIDPRLKDRINIVDRLNDSDAFIATGSDNSARYFKYYFNDKPNIIRANRTSLAVLDGAETEEDYINLGKDVFEYFGLGCRNVSKLYVPVGYKFDSLLDVLEEYSWVGDHHKYRNNYDYNKSIYLVNNEPHLDNGFLLLRKSDRLVSPISVLYFEEYSSQKDFELKLSTFEFKIQCIVGKNYLPFGEAQKPQVWDYADGVDTMKFLSSF